ncbi:amidohydrolase family protein [Membranihabitans maritimus]|uniref:amidohydrolase family protein n=1 Tax=Membranihabitans maritimus TaxID=2904244 RepID=UPI001F1DE73A|nr:amidohydrolase family protein [Membranihabitans maritimus]
MTKNYKILLAIIISSIIGANNTVTAQGSPADSQSLSMALQGGTIHIGNGEIIENGTVVFEKGLITYVGDENQQAEKNIDVSGQHIYPGLIAPNTRLGITEVDAVRSTRDFAEVGQYNPHIRALIAYNTDSDIIPTVRSNGILLAEITPSGGIISGQSSIVQLDAWNWEDAVYNSGSDEYKPAGIHLNWPSPYKYDRSINATTANDSYKENVDRIYKEFAEARAYQKIEGTPDPENLRFEAMAPVFDKSVRVFVHVNHKKGILDVIQFGESFGLKIVITGGNEAWKVADYLAEQEVPVVINATQRLPQSDDSSIDQPFKMASILEDANVLWCFSHHGSWEQRNLPFQAGQAVGFGLDQEAAIRALTLNTAKIYGIDQTLGSIEKGKDATIVVSDGNIMDPQSSIILHAFINGRTIDLDNKHKELYRKFGSKYGILD